MVQLHDKRLIRPTLLATLVAGVALSQLICPAGLQAEPERPVNFVIIMADDLGYGDLGCYGGERSKTPNIDALATGGLKFLDFHSSGAVCSPTRAGLMTGRYQQRVGVPGVITAAGHRHIGMPLAEVTFAEVLKEAGYATGMFGKWHLGYQPKFNPVHQGFDQFRGYVSGNVDFFSHVDQVGKYDWWEGDKQIEEEGYVTHLITKHSVKFIEEHQDRPFCLYVAHEAPHYPYQGPGDKPLRTVGGKFNNQGARKDIAQAYKEMVEAMDDGVGEIVAALKKHDLEEDTLVMFFSDNGANQRGSNGALRGHKGSVWEGGHRVPCLARWPGVIEAGETTDVMTITLDIFPTLVELAGAKHSPQGKIDGVSLAGLLRDQTPLERERLFWGTRRGRAMRDGDWKLVAAGKGKPMLFDLGEDLAEATDLAGKHPDRAAKMINELGDWEQEVGPSEFPSAERRRDAN